MVGHDGMGIRLIRIVGRNIRYRDTAISYPLAGDDNFGWVQCSVRDEEGFANDFTSAQVHNK